MKYPQIETYPKGFSWPPSEEIHPISDEKSSDIANLAACQDVSYLRFEILDAKPEGPAVYKGKLSSIALKVLEKCSFEISGVEHKQVEEQNVESALARLRLEASRQKTTEDGDHGNTAALVLLEDPEILKKRLKSDFADLCEFSNVEFQNGLRLPVDELYQLLLKFESQSNISSIAPYEDIVELCRTIYRKYLSDSRHFSEIEKFNNESMEATMERLKVVNILILFISALQKQSEDALLVEDVLLASFSFLLFLSELLSRQEVVNRLSEPSPKLFQELSYEFTKSITLISTKILNSSLPESIINKLDFLALRILSKEFCLNSSDEYTLAEAGVDILTKLYNCFPSQRKFLLHEVLNNSCSVFSKKITAQGADLMPFSALLINFVSCMGSSNLEECDISADQALARQQRSMKNVRNSSNNSLVVSNQIAEYLVRKACVDSKAEGSSWLKVLQGFLDDLLRLNEMPDTIPCEVMLYTMVWKLIDASESDTSRNTALDLAAHIAKSLSPPPSLNDRFVEFVNFTEPQFRRYVQSALSIANFLKKNQVEAYNYFVTSFLKDLDVMSASELEHGEEELDIKLAPNLARQALTIIVPFGYGYDWSSLNLELPRSPLGEQRKLEILVSEDITNSVTIYKSFRPISRCYDLILRNLLHQLKSVKIARKSKALRSIASIMETNSDVFGLKQVQEALCECIIHDSILVREAAIDIVGKFALKETNLSPHIYDLLCMRANDSGIAVRKKIINILKNGLASTLTYGTPIWRKTMNCFFQRLDDVEPFIVTEVMGTLSTQIFGGSVSSEVPDDEYDLNAPRYSYWIRTILGFYKENPRSVKNFFRKCLKPFYGDDHSLDLVDKKSFRAQCKIICEYAVDSLDEADFSDAPMAPYSVISFLASCDGSLLNQDQVELLSVYLTPQGTRDTSCAMALTSVRDSVMEPRNVFSNSTLKDLQETVLVHLSDYSFIEQDAAVTLLSAICRRRKNHKTIANVLSTCLDALENENELDYTKRLVKLIKLTSGLARYCDEQTSLHIYSRGRELKTGIRHYTIGKLLKYTKEGANSRICGLAIRSIGEICTGDSQLFFQKDVLELFDRVMIPSDSQKERLHELSNESSVMSFLLDILLEESEGGKRGQPDDKNKEQREKKRRKLGQGTMGNWVSGVNIRDLKGLSETSFRDGASVGLIQRYLDEIRRIALLPPNKNNESAVILAAKLLEQVCLQGLAHPKSFVSAIIALGVSPQAQTRALAKSAYSVMLSKYKSVLENSYAESFKAVFEYEKSLGGKRSQSINPLNELYLIVRDNKTSRAKFITNVIKALEFDAFRNSIDNLRHHYEFAVYFSKAFSFLPFGTYGEVLSILRGIESFIVTDGSELWSRIEEDDEEQPDGILGMSCGIMVVLWRLRVFLKDYYDISESRIKQKDTSTTRNTKTGAVSKTVESIDLSDLSNKTGIDSDLKRIALFREVMEDELNINNDENSDEEFD